MATTLGDDEVEVFIEWLSQKETINKSAIKLAINALTELLNDRRILARELERMRFKEPDDV